MTKLKITQVKSSVRATERQQATLASLGIRKIHQVVEVENNPIIKGMVDKVLHLVKVEEIN
ncbi:MAG: 50S ribosomal protein L30 [Bacteroidetes bacterium 41-46]|jgi:large subunit ribosomal protein L30|nr:MAG: 50S ribosomal protein L30 [Bacteroidetes bacterium 41-46]